MARKKRSICITSSGKRVSRKKTGRRGCPKGSRPSRRKRRRR